MNFFGFQVETPHAGQDIHETSRGVTQGKASLFPQKPPGGTQDIIKRCQYLMSGNGPAWVGINSTIFQPAVWRVTNYYLRRFQGYGGRFDITHDYFHPVRKSVKQNVSCCLIGQVLLNFQPESMPCRFCEQQHQKDHAAACA